jgi:hypothetical protein
MGNIYKDIKLIFNDESWRYDRLKSVVDFFDESIKNKTVQLEDDKGTLNIYIIARLSDYEKFWIKWIWEDNNEKKVKFIRYRQIADSPTFCPHCSKEPQIEDDNLRLEINQYLNYLNYNNNI